MHGLTLGAAIFLFSVSTVQSTFQELVQQKALNKRFQAIWEFNGQTTYLDIHTTTATFPAANKARINFEYKTDVNVSPKHTGTAHIDVTEKGAGIAPDSEVQNDTGPFTGMRHYAESIEKWLNILMADDPPARPSTRAAIKPR